ncbi:1-acyl-sn-glycerol-3-phosphate acyltransferase 1, chloroplastic [Porphyridium purpureum]|uniref:1-acyl-sn-glycerol-3-phosphate acyltransferase 1, chloroplastic n=1 Tax=Porphyridium purpureum TaxID=35688 RepID=A0A5J4YK04_PORPP|nr:1-acyl-sn-glycerol-3-phosphate acyltransferase 1, chloroplastic [Porphyridium purpureum]|eukprot:POR4921..scf244_11
MLAFGLSFAPALNHGQRLAAPHPVVSRGGPYCVEARRSAVRMMSSSAAAAPSPSSGNGKPHGGAPEKHKKDKSIKLIGLLFAIVTFAWSIPLFCIMLVAHPFVKLFDAKQRKFQDFISNLWCRLSMLTVGIKPRMIGAENLPKKDEVVIYVANHTSFTDIYTMAWLDRRAKWVAKVEVLRIPIVGWAMQMTKHVCLQRGDRRAQLEAYRAMLQTLKDGNSLVVYPEGTRSSDGRLRRFQSGAFKAAKSVNVPVIPLTLLGTRDFMPASAYLPVQYPKNGVQIVVHPRIMPDHHTDAEMLSLAFEAIDSALPRELQAGSARVPAEGETSAGSTV